MQVIHNPPFQKSFYAPRKFPKTLWCPKWKTLLQLCLNHQAEMAFHWIFPRLWEAPVNSRSSPVGDDFLGLFALGWPTTSLWTWESTCFVGTRNYRWPLCGGGQGGLLLVGDHFVGWSEGLLWVTISWRWSRESTPYHFLWVLCWVPTCRTLQSCVDVCRWHREHGHHWGVWRYVLWYNWLSILSLGHMVLGVDTYFSLLSVFSISFSAPCYVPCIRVKPPPSLPTLL